MTQVVDKQLIAKNAQRQPAIAHALVSLGSLLRYSMKWRSDTVALSEELANIQSYIQTYIQFINFMEGGSTVLTAELPQEVLRYAIPKMVYSPSLRMLFITRHPLAAVYTSELRYGWIMSACCS